jgi:hypothetical protein
MDQSPYAVNEHAQKPAYDQDYSYQIKQSTHNIIFFELGIILSYDSTDSGPSLVVLKIACQIAYTGKKD